MSQSLSQIYVHAVFSTKGRIACLRDPIRRELFPYMAKVLRTLECPAIEVGGLDDHMHILCNLSRNLAPKQLIEKAKVDTSKFLKRKGVAYGRFCWQAGYGIFSVSQSALGRVQEYIQNQAEHHRTRGYQEEFLGLLKKHKVDYDPEQVWD